MAVLIECIYWFVGLRLGLAAVRALLAPSLFPEDNIVDFFKRL